MQIAAGTIVRYTKTQTKLLVAIVASVFVGAASTAAVFASIPDSSGVITGCYSTGLGAKVRIIDSATTPNCNATETKITWNQKGIKGDTGLTGAVGPQGPQGSQGPAGASAGGSENTAGRVVTVAFGDIPQGSTPRPLYSIPGFGDVAITKCDSVGDVDYSFHNTSGQTINFPTSSGTMSSISPNQTVSYSDGDAYPFTAMSIGNGSTSHVAYMYVSSYPSTENQLCTFYGGII